LAFLFFIASLLSPLFLALYREFVVNMSLEEQISPPTNCEQSPALPSIDELQAQFPDYQSVLQQLMVLQRDNYAMRQNFVVLKKSYQEITQENAKMKAEKESLEHLRHQLKREAEGILKDAHVIRQHHERTRSNSHDEADTVSASPRTTVVTPKAVEPEPSKSPFSFFGAASRPLRVSCGTQTDSAPVTAKAYITMRERNTVRQEFTRNHTDSSCGTQSNEDGEPNSIGSSALSPRPLAISVSDDAEESAYQATTFQDFVRMRREIVELRAKVQQLQPGNHGSLSPFSASRVSTPTGNSRLHGSSISPGSTVHVPVNKNTTMRSVSNHSTSTASSCSSHGSSMGRMGPIPVAGTHLIDTTLSPRGVSGSSSLPHLKSSPTTFGSNGAKNNSNNNNNNSSANASAPHNQSMFGQFLPKLHA
jgi:hypothetical protein